MKYIKLWAFVQTHARPRLSSAAQDAWSAAREVHRHINKGAVRVGPLIANQTGGHDNSHSHGGAE